MAGFPDDILQQLALAFKPVQDALTDTTGAKLQALLANFGWTYTPPTGGVSGVLSGSSFGHIITDISNVVSDAEAVSPDIGQLSEDVLALLNDLQNLSDPTNSLSAAAAPFSLSQFWNGTSYTISGNTVPGPRFVDDLLGYLVCNYVQQEVPLAYGLLRFIGVFSTTNWPALQANTSTGFPGRAAYTQQAVDVTKLFSAFSQPQAVLSDVYNWGSTNTSEPFEADQLLQNLGAVFGAFNVAASVLPGSNSLYALYFDPVATSPATLSQLSIMPFSYALVTGGSPVAGNFKISLNALPIPASGTRTGNPVGFVLFPLATGQVTAKIPLCTSPTVTVSLNGNFSVIPILIEIRPAGVAITSIASGAGAATTLNAEARIDATAPTGSPWTLIGDPDGSNLSLAGVHFSIDANGPPTDPSTLAIKIELGLDSLAVNLDFSDSDSFISSIFGSSVQSIQASPALNWSNVTGFGFSGQAALTATIPIYQTILGVIDLDTIVVTLAAGASSGGNGVSLTVAVSGSVTLGPIEATVDQIGFQIQLGTSAATGETDNKGLASACSANIGLAGPKGLGVSLDLPPASGGGYISCDPVSGQYSGILSVAIDAPMAEIQITIIGLLETKIPNDPGDFSFLLIVSVEFTPIQIGMGFTLNGVGGIGGMNRSMSTTALQTGFHNHTLDNILFPQDPIGQATQIVSAVSAAFPVAVGQYVLGPVLELGWGTPTIVTIELGIVVTFPQPVVVALLGQLLVGLPTADDLDEALIVIQVDVLGTIDFSQQVLTIQATLYGSRIVMFPIAGDMYLLLNWSSSPQFVLSLGGFNPHFQAPAGIPSLARLSLSLGNSNVGLSLTTYFAVTSNTLQFGASVAAWATAGGFGVKAQLSFDALFIFSPFSFIVDMQATAEVVAGSSVLMSIDLSLTLSGPQPWRAQGSASFSIFFFSVSVNVDLTIGNPSTPAPLPQVQVLPQLQSSLQAIGNWQALLSDDLRFAVSLASPAPGDTSLVVHPMGQLAVAEKVVPLDLPISLFGNGTPEDGTQFTIAAVTVNGLAPADLTDQDGEFALAQFQTMSDSAKLAAQAFQPFHAGKVFGSSAITPGTPSTLQLTYDTHYIDDVMMPALRAGLPYTPGLTTMLSNSRQGAAAQAKANSPGLRKYINPGTLGAVQINDAQYVVAQLSDLSTTSITGPTSQGYAQAALAAHLSSNPDDDGTLAVLPTYETSS